MAVIRDGQVAQLVEQRTENPRVGGSIPPLATKCQRPPIGGLLHLKQGEIAAEACSIYRVASP